MNKHRHVSPHRWTLFTSPLAHYQPLLILGDTLWTAGWVIKAQDPVFSHSNWNGWRDADDTQCSTQIDRLPVIERDPNDFSTVFTTLKDYYYYRVMLRRARYCQGKFSVRPSVRLSVTLRYRGHIGWNSWKIISRQIPISRIYCKGNPQNFSRDRSGVGKIADFRHLSRCISETVQDMVKVAIDRQ